MLFANKSQEILFNNQLKLIVQGFYYFLLLKPKLNLQTNMQCSIAKVEFYSIFLRGKKMKNWLLSVLTMLSLYSLFSLLTITNSQASTKPNYLKPTQRELTQICAKIFNVHEHMIRYQTKLAKKLLRKISKAQKQSGLAAEENPYVLGLIKAQLLKLQDGDYNPSRVALVLVKPKNNPGAASRWIAMVPGKLILNKSGDLINFIDIQSIHWVDFEKPLAVYEYLDQGKSLLFDNSVNEATSPGRSTGFIEPGLLGQLFESNSTSERKVNSKISNLDADYSATEKRSAFGAVVKGRGGENH